MCQLRDERFVLRTTIRKRRRALRNRTYASVPLQQVRRTLCTHVLIPFGHKRFGCGNQIGRQSVEPGRKRSESIRNILCNVLANRHVIGRSVRLLRNQRIWLVKHNIGKHARTRQVVDHTNRTRAHRKTRSRQVGNLGALDLVHVLPALWLRRPLDDCIRRRLH